MRILRFITLFFLGLMPVALITSMAAMEIISWSLFLFFLIHIGRDLKIEGFKSVIRRLKTGIDWALWGYFFLAITSAFIMVSSREDQVFIIGSCRWVFLVYSYNYLFKKYFNVRWERLIPVYSSLICLTGLYSAAQFLWGVEYTRDREILAKFGEYYRASAFFNMPLTFAYSIGMFSFVLLGIALVSIQAKKRYGLTAVGSAGGFIGVITSLTRGAWLSAVCSIFIMLLNFRKKWALGSLAVAALAAVAMYFSNSTLQSRFESLVDKDNQSNNLRILLWEANWEIIKDHPWLGVGLTKNKDYLQGYYSQMGVTESFTSHAHNNYLQIWAGVGSFGLMFYLIFCAYFIWVAWKLFKSTSKQMVLIRGLAIGIFAAQIFVHVGGLTECNFTDGEVNHMIIFMWGLVGGMRWLVNSDQLHEDNYSLN